MLIHFYELHPLGIAFDPIVHTCVLNYIFGGVRVTRGALIGKDKRAIGEIKDMQDKWRRETGHPATYKYRQYEDGNRNDGWRGAFLDY